jgi:hypothetical protein
MRVTKGQADTYPVLHTLADSSVNIADIPFKQVFYLVIIRRLPFDLYDVDTWVEFKGVLNFFKISSQLIWA